MAHSSSSLVEVRTDWACAAPPDSETVFLRTTECGLRHTLCSFSRRKQNHRALSGGLVAKLCPGQDQKYLEEAEFLSSPEPAYLSRSLAKRGPWHPRQQSVRAQRQSILGEKVFWESR